MRSTAFVFFGLLALASIPDLALAGPPPDEIKPSDGASVQASAPTASPAPKTDSKAASTPADPPGTVGLSKPEIPAEPERVAPAAGLKKPTSATTEEPARTPKARKLRPPPPNPKLILAGRIIAGVMAAAAVGFGIAGGVELGVREQHVALFNDDARCLGNGMLRIVNCGDEYTAVSHSETRAVELFLGGAAFATTAVLLFLVTRPEKPRQEKLRPTTVGLGCGPGPGAIGVACGGQF